MDVTNMQGSAWRRNEPVGEFVLNGGRRPGVGGRVVEDIRIRFEGFVAKDVLDALEVIAKRIRLPKPLMVDLKFSNGTEVNDCEITCYWGGRNGERWYGIDFDLDAMKSA